ncbi:hypothetical protein SynA15127_02391 [Synechococcus sp. A15-127]|nr:hypothetical protein SynA15127_02391 [Synechococcus sp. A15-127]
MVFRLAAMTLTTSLERSGLEAISKEGQLGLLFLRVVRSLNALMRADASLDGAAQYPFGRAVPKDAALLGGRVGAPGC